MKYNLPDINMMTSELELWEVKWNNYNNPTSSITDILKVIICIK